jgi:hypothetical protein
MSPHCEKALPHRAVRTPSPAYGQRSPGTARGRGRPGTPGELTFRTDVQVDGNAKVPDLPAQEAEDWLVGYFRYS